MTLKQQLHELVETLNDDESAVEQMQYQLYVLGKVRKGLQQIEAGQGIPHEQAVKRMERWLTK